MATIPTQIRIDKTIKEDANNLFSQLGLDMSSAVNIFLRQCLLHGGLPFSVEIPKFNEKTLVYFAVRFIYFSSAKKCACMIDVDALLKEDGRFINYIFLIYVICFLIVVHNFYRTGGTLMTAKAYVNYDSTAIERLAMILMVSLSGIGSVLLMRKEYIRFSV